MVAVCWWQLQYSCGVQLLGLFSLFLSLFSSKHPSLLRQEWAAQLLWVIAAIIAGVLCIIGAIVAAFYDLSDRTCYIPN